MDFVDPPADGWLSKEEFVELYNSCGAIVHADNPNGEKTDYADYEKKVPLWHKKITGLLNSHLIKLIDDPNIYLIQMGSPEERPSYTIFGPKVS